jgi:hypothetical protein
MMGTSTFTTEFLAWNILERAFGAWEAWAEVFRMRGFPN